MNVYPLAIYTADHGLSWNFPKEEISFQEIDACRKAFGQLPDFDSGAIGFDGVWAKGNRVFIMRCQSVAAWDFRGRNATYLAVTWIPRRDADKIDFDKLLNTEAMSIPSKTPPLFFNADVEIVSNSLVATPGPYLTDGFVRVGAIIKGLPEETTVAVKRVAGNSQASLVMTESIDNTGHSLASLPHDNPHHVGEATMQPSSAALMVLLAVWFLTTAATAVLWFKWQAAMKENSDLSARLNSAEVKIAELESDNKKLLEANGASSGPRCTTPYLNRIGFPSESFYYFLWLH